MTERGLVYARLLILSEASKQSEHCLTGCLTVVETPSDHYEVSQLVGRGLSETKAVLVDVARQDSKECLADLVVGPTFLGDAVEQRPHLIPSDVLFHGKEGTGEPGHVSLEFRRQRAASVPALRAELVTVSRRAPTGTFGPGWDGNDLRSVSAVNLVSALPMAFVMVAGPQIVTAIMLATSKRPKPNSLAFLAGVAAATTLGLTAFYVFASAVHPDSGESSAGSTTLNVICLLLLVVLAGLVYRNRGKTEPPGWMTKLQDADAGFALRIGFLLFAVMPSDLITMFTVSNLFAHANDPWWHTLLFMGLTVVFAAIPFLLLLVMGRRAEVELPKVRNWMTDNSWIVNEIVVGFFLLMSLNSLFG